MLNGTDETDCEDFWCSLSSFKRCNGFWDCRDGRDELDCSLDSLPDNVKSTKLLHTSNLCQINEHLCFHVSNRSADLSRSCILSSLVDDGHVDCWGATDERHSVCNYAKSSANFKHAYRCAGERNVCISVETICDGRKDCPIGDDETVCDWGLKDASTARFQCRNGTLLIRHRLQCNGVWNCADGEDEWLCDLQIRRPESFYWHNILSWFYPPDLQAINKSIAHHTQARALVSSDKKSDWFCNRGIPVKSNGSRLCLCPPSYSGDRCENQRKRISISLNIVSPPTIQREVVIKLIVYLIDVASLHILVEEEIIHLPYIHASHKHLVLLSSAQANHSFVQIDAYDANAQQLIAYRTSWKFDIPFPFLPVRRLAVELILPNHGDQQDEVLASRKRFTCQKCSHGQCLTYENSPDVFCHCYDGWTGPTCIEPFLCAAGSKSLNSHKCLCPPSRHGIRCFAPNIQKCHCQNGGTCLPLDPRTEQGACLCTDEHFGRNCERMHAKVTIKSVSQDQPEILPIVLFQFVRLTGDSPMHFENVFLFEHLPSRRTLVILHTDHETLPHMLVAKVFYSSLIDEYTYYILLLIPSKIMLSSFQTKHIQTQLSERQRCLNIREIQSLKTPVNILAYPHIKRIKFYLRACDQDSISCFHDEVYLCICPKQANQSMQCDIYDHTREICRKPSYCLNEGLCVENRRKGMVHFACLCSSCHYYGGLCQFSTGQQGLSIDALVGMSVRTGKPLSEQSTLIIVSISTLICTITVGFFGNILCIITFAQQGSRKTGCGYYLFVISIYNQLTLVVLGLRFMYLLITQITVTVAAAKSLIFCKLLEFGLAFLPNLSSWLSACVSVERTIAVVRGVLFDRDASIRTARYFSLILPIAFMLINIHVSFTRELIDDPRLGRFTWCVSKSSSKELQTFVSILSVGQLLGPFIINLLSTGFLLRTIARQKLTVHTNKIKKSFVASLREQAIHYKHLIISPLLLLVLTLPRLIFSLVSLCINTSWRNYVLLTGYYISFIPFMATLWIFVLPSPIYRANLWFALSRIRQFCPSYGKSIISKK